MIKDTSITLDLSGYPFNSKYPPRGNKSQYHGYDNANQECVFYDFAVMGYDLKITYQGKSYYFMVDEDCVWLSDEIFSAQLQRFANGNDVIENFLIGDQKLLDIIDSLDYSEPF